MSTLVLGPALRHVGPTTATIWVQTSDACTVEVLGHRAPTFEVHGHHYALVTVRDLAPDTTRTYEVHLDGQRVWPDERAGTPPSRIRTRPAPGAGVPDPTTGGRGRKPAGGEDLPALAGPAAKPSRARKPASGEATGTPPATRARRKPA